MWPSGALGAGGIAAPLSMQLILYILQIVASGMLQESAKIGLWN
jgi:hypothetical protein